MIMSEIKYQSVVWVPARYAVKRPGFWGSLLDRIFPIYSDNPGGERIYVFNDGKITAQSSDGTDWTVLPSS